MRNFEDGTGNREDSQDQAWFRMYHPDVSFLVVSPPYKPAEKHSSLGNFLDSSSPDQCCPAVTSSSLHVLRSSENLKRIEEKEKEEKAKLQEKEERARK